MRKPTNNKIEYRINILYFSLPKKFPYRSKLSRNFTTEPNKSSQCDELDLASCISS